MPDQRKRIDAAAFAQAVRDYRNLNPNPDPILRMVEGRVYDRVLGLIEEAQEAEGEVVTPGYWIMEDPNSHMRRCSVCGSNVSFYGRMTVPRYCENCGMPMGRREPAT